MPNSVHERLSRHVLADGYKLVVDLSRSSGCRLVDARDGTEYLDCYSFFASLPLGFNHPDLTDDAFLLELGRAAVHKPANPDMYSVEYATFVETFARVLGDPASSSSVLRRGWRSCSRERTKGCIRLEVAQKRASRHPRAGRHGDAPASRISRPQRLHAQPDQH